MKHIRNKIYCYLVKKLYKYDTKNTDSQKQSRSEFITDLLDLVTELIKMFF